MAKQPSFKLYRIVRKSDSRVFQYVKLGNKGKWTTLKTAEQQQKLTEEIQKKIDNREKL